MSAASTCHERRIEPLKRRRFAAALTLGCKRASLTRDSLTRDSLRVLCSLTPTLTRGLDADCRLAVLAML